MKRLPFWLLLAGLCTGPALAADPYPTEDAAIAERLRLLALQAAEPADRAWVESLLDHEESEHLPHPERPSLGLPRYRIRARAHALLHHWRLQTELRAWQSEPAKRHEAASTALQRKARALWLEQASPAELASFRARQPASALDEASLLVLLRRGPHMDDWRALMRIGGSRRTIDALAGARGQLAPDEFSALLDLAEANPRLAGMAVRLRGDWARSRPEQARRLLERLRKQPLSVDLIEAGIAADLPELPTLLVSRLTDTEAAPLAAWGLWRLDESASLSAFASAPGTPVHLREEIRRWLD